MEHKPVAPNDAAAEREAGELWSYLRMVMAKGANIGVDFATGKMTYEQHSAHLDAEASYFAKLLPRAARAPLRDDPKDSGESKKNQQNSGPEGGAISFALYAFLMGISDIDGVSFGEMHPTLKGRYWWRHRLANEYGPSRPPVPLTTEGENRGE